MSSARHADGRLHGGLGGSALKAGAFNYLAKPIPDFDAAAAVLHGAAKVRQLQREVLRLKETASEVERSRKLVGSSSAIKSVLAAID